MLGPQLEAGFTDAPNCCSSSGDPCSQYLTLSGSASPATRWKHKVEPYSQLLQLRSLTPSCAATHSPTLPRPSSTVTHDEKKQKRTSDNYHGTLSPHALSERSHGLFHIWGPQGYEEGPTSHSSSKCSACGSGGGDQGLAWIFFGDFADPIPNPIPLS